METLRPAAAVLLSREGKMWLGRRGQTRFLPGFSVFPGGAAEPGESFVETALRELEEETGLKNGRAQNLIPFARAITPPYSKYRFDVQVYRLELESSQEPVADGVELVHGEWFEPAQLFGARAHGEVQLAPPTFRQARLWARCEAGLELWPTEAEAFADPPIRNEQVLPLLPDLTLIPVRTGALPPAAWTNTAIIGQDNFIVLDPGGEDLTIVKQEVAARVAQGARLMGVVLSHHHTDHLAGASQFDAPLYCHPNAMEHLPSELSTPKLLEDQQEIMLGNTLLRFHHTPGHAPGHLAVEMPLSQTLLAGDMISSLSSVVIPEKTGSLTDYLHSLERLKQLPCHLVVPAHGPPLGRGSAPFEQALLHRAKRESQILYVLKKGPRTAAQLVGALYPGLNPALTEAAHSNIGHYLQKLSSENRVNREAEFWAIKGDAERPLPE